MRWKYIDKSMKGEQDYIFTWPVLFPYFFEEVWAETFNLFSSPLRAGSGKTEWYRGGVAIEMAMVIYIMTIWSIEFSSIVILSLIIGQSL